MPAKEGEEVKEEEEKERPASQGSRWSVIRQWFLIFRFLSSFDENVWTFPPKTNVLSTYTKQFAYGLLPPPHSHPK